MFKLVVLLLVIGCIKSQHHQIRIENKSPYRLRVRADSERIREKKVRSQKSGGSKNAFGDKNYKKDTNQDINIKNIINDYLSRQFNAKHHDTVNHDSATQSSSHSDSKSSSQDAETEISGKYNGGVASGEAKFAHKKAKSSASANSDTDYNQYDRTQQNVDDLSADSTLHTKKTDFVDERNKFEHIFDHQQSAENEARFHSEYSAELEHTLIEAGFAIIEPFGNICLTTNNVMAYVTITAFTKTSEIYLWQNQQTTEEYLEININEISNNPQVNNGFLEFIPVLHDIGLAEFIPKFEELGWKDESIWNKMNDIDFEEIGFKKAHKYIFEKHRDNKRLGYKMEWEQFKTNITQKLEDDLKKMKEKNEELQTLINDLTKELNETINDLNQTIIKRKKVINEKIRRNKGILEVALRDIERIDTDKESLEKTINEKETAIIQSINYLRTQMYGLSFSFKKVTCSHRAEWEASCYAACPSGYTLLSGGCETEIRHWWIHQSTIGSTGNGWYCAAHSGNKGFLNKYIYGYANCYKIQP